MSCRHKIHAFYLPQSKVCAVPHRLPLPFVRPVCYWFKGDSHESQLNTKNYHKFNMNEQHQLWIHPGEWNALFLSIRTQKSVTIIFFGTIFCGRTFFFWLSKTLLFGNVCQSHSISSFFFLFFQLIAGAFTIKCVPMPNNRQTRPMNKYAINTLNEHFCVNFELDTIALSSRLLWSNICKLNYM